MDQQEEGWPLGLNRRVGMERNPVINGSISFNTLLTGSPFSSTDSSSDLDTESTGSFFHDNSITLGNLIGISSILELSRRSTRGRKSEPVIRQDKKTNKSKAWFLSLCSRGSTDAINNAQSLGHFLEAERRAANTHTRNPTTQTPNNAFGPDDFSRVLDPNLLFVDGEIAPPQSSDLVEANGERMFSGELLSHHSRCAVAADSSLFSCLCGHFSH